MSTWSKRRKSSVITGAGARAVMHSRPTGGRRGTIGCVIFRRKREARMHQAGEIIEQQNSLLTSLTPMERTSLSVNFESPQVRSYAADVTALIKRSLELANWPPLERNKQLPRRIAFWTEALFPRIERARLPLAFDEALDTHR